MCVCIQNIAILLECLVIEKMICYSCSRKTSDLIDQITK